MAQRRRGLLRQTDPKAPEKRRLPLHRRPTGRPQQLIKEHNQETCPFIWRENPDDIIAAVRRGHQTLESIHQEGDADLSIPIAKRQRRDR